MSSSWRLSLIDMMAAVVAAGVGLACVAWAAPGRAGPALIVIGPLVGILWHRGRGGRGILGGVLGGAGYAGVGLVSFFTATPGSNRAGPSTMANWPIQLVYMTAVCLAFGTCMGAVAWLAAAAMGRPRAPAPRGYEQIGRTLQAATQAATAKLRASVTGRPPPSDTRP